MARKIEVQIVGDADSFHRAISKATGTTSKFGHVLGGAFAVGAAAAGTALVGLGVAAKIGFDEMNDQQKVAAQTGAVLKSTGGAANVTAKHVKALGDQLLNLSGVDDEVIKSGENMLLTFTQIRNRAGKNNDIFDQATKVTLDLSTAMGLDMKQAALQVGKALNDPARGFSRLQRIGVAFTPVQEKLIKNFAATGQTAKAQKVILAELNKEFGGSAKAAGQTLGGQLDILKEKFKNAAGAIVGTLLPYVLKLANFAFPLAVTAIRLVVDSVRSAVRAIARLASHFQILGGSSASASSRVRNAWNTVVAFFKAHFLPIIRQVVNIYRDGVTAIARVMAQHGPELQRIWTRLSAVMRAVATVLQTVVLPIVRIVLTKILPKAIGIAITALDKISFAVETLVGWFRTVAGWIDTVIGKLGAFADKVGAVKDKAGSILGAIGLTAGAPTTAPSGPAPTLTRTPVIQNHIYLDSKEIHASVKNQDRVYRRQNGRSAFA